MHCITSCYNVHYVIRTVKVRISNIHLREKNDPNIISIYSKCLIDVHVQNRCWVKFMN